MISTADINFDPSSKQNEDRLKKLREDEQASIEEARRRQEGKNANLNNGNEPIAATNYSGDDFDDL